jgi:threonine dehydratase
MWCRNSWLSERRVPRDVMNTAPIPAQSTREVVRPTTFIEAAALSRRFAATVTLASETFQHTGSFKFRAAYNVASGVPQRHIIAASSGNFGQALAAACALLGKTCSIVMPDTSARVKIEAVREFGGTVDLIDVRVKSRKQRVEELAQKRPDAYLASAYDDPLVIEGNATLGTELASRKPPFDFIIAPIGGGGLSSGIITGLRAARCDTPVVAAEPMLANEAARSLRAGQIIANETEPLTIADGARTVSVGQRNWAILRDELPRVIEVSEEQIKEAMRILFSLANLKSEPTGALSLAALLAEPDFFRGQDICCVISGGNVDSELFREILAG